MVSRILVLDANILIRAVLGNRVRTLMTTYSETVDFFTPDVCMADAQKYLPMLFEKRSLPVEPALTLLSSLECLLHVVDKTLYNESAEEARLRIKSRDVQDWPVVVFYNHLILALLACYARIHSPFCLRVLLS